MYPGQIILLSARVREGHILKAKFRLGGKAGAQGGSCPPAGAAHASNKLTTTRKSANKQTEQKVTNLLTT